MDLKVNKKLNRGMFYKAAVIGPNLKIGESINLTNDNGKLLGIGRITKIQNKKWSLLINEDFLNIENASNLKELKQKFWKECIEYDSNEYNSDEDDYDFNELNSEGNVNIVDIFVEYLFV